MQLNRPFATVTPTLDGDVLGVVLVEPAHQGVDRALAGVAPFQVLPFDFGDVLMLIAAIEMDCSDTDPQLALLKASRSVRTRTDGRRTASYPVMSGEAGDMTTNSRRPKSSSRRGATRLLAIA